MQEENKQKRNVGEEIIERIFVTSPAWFNSAEHI